MGRAWAMATIMIRALKHTAGILLATVGVMFLMATAFSISEPEPDVPTWMLAGALLVVGLIPLGGAVALLWPAVRAKSKPCPQCGGSERQAAGVLRRSNSLWLFYFCGWLFSSLWGASREKQVRCAQCETLYMTDTRGTRIAGIVFWVLLLLVLSGMVAEALKRH